tara:strand:- start:859 stop:1206 length:348 start_codon:yes stop_codon:yes gene_type:complete
MVVGLEEAAGMFSEAVKVPLGSVRDLWGRTAFSLEAEVELLGAIEGFEPPVEDLEAADDLEAEVDDIAFADRFWRWLAGRATPRVVDLSVDILFGEREVLVDVKKSVRLNWYVQW